MPLEELTPQLPHPAHWVRDALACHHGRSRRRIDDDLVLTLGHAFWVDPDHPVVNASFLDHQRAHFGIALEAACARDLETAGSDDIAAYEPGDRDPDGANIGLDMGFGADQKVAVALDLAAEVAKQLAAAFQLQPARQRVVATENCRLLLDTMGVGPPVTPGNRDSLHPNVRHLDLPYPAPRLFPIRSIDATGSWGILQFPPPRVSGQGGRSEQACTTHRSGCAFR